MLAPCPPRDRERGNSLLLALIVMSALATLGGLTVVSTQSNLKTSTNNRAQTIALYAAESGAAVAMDFLGAHFNNTNTGAPGWSAYVTAQNGAAAPISTALIPSSDALPSTPNNLFSPEQRAWFEIMLLNNRDDPGFDGVTPPLDQDSRIIIRSTGHGPQGALAIIEWEVQRADYTRGWATPPGPDGFPVVPNPWLPPPAYGWAFAEPLLASPPTPRAGMVLLGWHVVSL